MARRSLTLEAYSRSERQLSYSATISGLRFTTSFWYDSVDFSQLEDRFGRDLLERIYFHIFAFDLNRLVSLRPTQVDFGPLRRHVSASFVELWNRVIQKVWSQWRYENGLPHYPPPAVAIAHAESLSAPAMLESGDVRSLAFCGGGKDSLVALQLLQRLAEPYDSLVYSHSVYGDHGKQHRLIGGVLDQCRPNQRHRVWVFDDFMPSPVLSLTPDFEVRTMTAAETPASLFFALPLALAHGFSRFILAHEKSADTGNLIWDATGEEINHQWGKSLEAERLLAAYVKRHLIENLDYFSILKPVHDAVIFPSLRPYARIVPSLHSCNLEKPWCRRCPKCAYVWLNFLAYLPGWVTDKIFGENLFDAPENQLWFRQLLGLEDHTPFECVGKIEESRLAFELCRRKGHQGRAMQVYAEHFPAAAELAEFEELFRVQAEDHAMPPDWGARVLPLLESYASSAQAHVASKLL